MPGPDGLVRFLPLCRLCVLGFLELFANVRPATQEDLEALQAAAERARATSA